MMNNTIKELAEKAKPRDSDGNVVRGLDSEYHDLWMKQYAELIVKKCTKMLRDIDWAYDLFVNGSDDPDERDDPNAVAIVAADYIEEQFGIQQ